MDDRESFLSKVRNVGVSDAQMLDAMAHEYVTDPRRAEIRLRALKRLRAIHGKMGGVTEDEVLAALAADYAELDAASAQATTQGRKQRAASA